jgi:DNA-binding SARP family transcriptional activator/energy-coupling factor transporter ATP-binding protein EcfA2
MHLRVLGPLEVWDDARLVDPGGPRERRALSLLALRVGQSVSRDELIDALWPTSPPKTAPKVVQNVVLHLRQRLRSSLGDVRIETTPFGYRLLTTTEGIDTLIVRSLAEEGMKALEAADYPGAVRRLRDALSWWRGRPLSDLEDVASISADVRELEELRGRLYEQLFEAELAAGRHAEVVPELEAALGVDRFHESLWRLLMVALYRSGRQHDALEVYQRVRHLLIEELGVEPGPALRQTETDILAQASTLALLPQNYEAGELPVPQRLSMVPAIGMMGRVSETGQLVDCYHSAARGEGRQVVVLSGEPGVGKSTLAAHAARLMLDEGATVLYGSCDEDLRFPYQPFTEAIGHYLGHASDSWLDSYVRSRGPEIVRLVPSLAGRFADLPRPPGNDPEAERYLLYVAVEKLLDELSGANPVVLVIDDLHWADTGTLQLLRHLIANVLSSRLVIIGTFRQTDPPISPFLPDTLAALRREPGVSRLDLKGLEEDEVAQFAQATVGRQLDEIGLKIARTLHQETAGNPFFVGEVLRDLLESGTVVVDDAGHWATSSPGSFRVPDSVREVVTMRIRRLGADAPGALGTAAVIGQAFDVEILEQVCGLDESELLNVLDGATTASLVAEVEASPGRFIFSHALVQSALYQDLGSARRSRIHRLVACALEALPDSIVSTRVTELAHHWANTGKAADRYKAVQYTRAAGKAALEALAPEDAVAAFIRALEILGEQAKPDQLLHTDLLLDLGTAQRLSGDPAFRQTLLTAASSARELRASDRLVRAALANRGTYFSGVGIIDFERVEMLEAAINALPERDSADRAVLIATLGAELAWGPIDRRLELAASAKAMARRLADPVTTLRVLFCCQYALRAPASSNERYEDTAELLSLAESLGDPDNGYWANGMAHTVGMQTGDFDRARHCLSEMRRLVQQLRQPSVTWDIRFVEAADALAYGDADRAETLANEALHWGTETGQRDALSFYGTQLAIARLEQGRLGELETLVEKVAADNPSIDALQALLAVASLEAGHLGRSAEILELATSQGFQQLAPDAAWLTGAVNYARVAIELGDTEAGELLFGLLEPWSAQIPYNAVTAHEPVAMFLGGLAAVLERHEVADEYFDRAAATARRGGLKFADAHTKLLWGRSLLARGDRERACTALEAAQRLATGYGYGSVGRRVDEELRGRRSLRDRLDPSVFG